LNEYYAIDSLIDAARQLERAQARRVKIVICGDGRMRKEVEAESRQSSSLVYLGALSADEMKGALAGADLALVSLSPIPICEAVFPGKLFDALMTGLPVLTNIKGHAESLVNASGGGWAIPAADGEKIALEIQRIAELSASELAARGRAGMEFARRHLSATQLARELPKWMGDATGGGFFRLIRAVLAGVGDVLSGRNSSYRRMPVADRSALIDERMEAWLASLNTQEGEHSRDHEGESSNDPTSSAVS
jgi:glycosyltransferase involved in cell wall biosynthesis